MTDKSIEYWAHMLDEAYSKDINEDDVESKTKDGGSSEQPENKNDEKKPEEKNEKKIDAKHLIKDIMVLEPAAALKFIAKQYDDSDPKAFLLKNLVPFTVYAVKNGFVKAKDIGMSVKDFAKKNKADATEIDFKNVDIDEDTMKKIYVIDDNVLKKLEDFISQYKDSMKDAQEDIEKAGEKLDKDIKDAGVKLEGEELADNATVVAGVIDKPENKKLTKKEKQQKVKAAIETKKQVKKLTDAAEKASKKKIKVDSKIAKMSDEELAKLNNEIEKKAKTKSDASKKNDALRSKLKAAVQNGVANDFKKSVKTQFLSAKNFKKVLAKNLKPGLKAESIEDDRVVCISVQCKKSDFKKILSEAAESKVIDISKGSKNKAVQKLVDYIKDAIKKTIGDKELGDFYVYRKQSTEKAGIDLLYVFAGVKQEALNEALAKAIISEALMKPKLPDGALEAIKKAVETGKIPGVPDNIKQSGDMLVKSVLKHDYPDFYKSITTAATRKAGKTLTKQLGMYANAVQTGDEKLISTTLKSIGQYSDAAKDAVKSVADTATDSVVDNASDVADATTNGNMPSFNYQSLSYKINDIDRMMKDGVIDPTEEAKILKLQEKIYGMRDWAYENQNSDNPLFKQKAALINQLGKKLDSKIDKIDEICAADEANSIAERVPDAASNSKDVAKLANNEQTKEMASGFLRKFGKALKSFGQAMAVAKVAKFALNNSKTLVDACGGMAMKFKENKDSIAQITVLVNNGDDADQKFSDTRFGVYFSADDLKWHATNLDDRKMKINGEEDLIKRVLDTNTGKEFKKEFLDRLSKLFEGDNGKTLKYFIKNYKTLGIKADKDVEKMFEKLKNIADSYDEVKKQFA